MRLTPGEIEEIDLEKLRPFVAGPNEKEFFEPREHYKLLALLSTLVPPSKRIIDIGTCYGDSALALSYNGHHVETFDVEDRVGERILPASVRRTLVDLFDPDQRDSWKNDLLTSGLILIDIAPHEGSKELELVQWLQANDYSGLIVLDDIWWYKEMRDNLWYRIDPKYRTDLTSLGHWSGTGVVSFRERLELRGEPDTSNWTLVTAYFDLTKMADASDALKSRPIEWYLDQHGSSVLSLDKNLVVFCDHGLKEEILKRRPEWLHDRTRVIEMSFENMPLTHYREQIISSRDGSNQCPSDPRATASYYLFCMARYAMMKQSILENVFGSTHFAWIDLGIERMGFNNLIHLDEALSQNRDKFSACFIDYVPKEMVRDLPSYFGGKSCYGRCSMSSGFFTGNASYMRRVCDRIEAEFLSCLDAGFGHADEQLYPIVYFKNPELFDWYLGDYTEIITNYSGVREKPESPIRNLISNSFTAGDHGVCKRACELLLESVASKKCALDPSSIEMLTTTLEACS